MLYEQDWEECRKRFAEAKAIAKEIGTEGVYFRLRNPATEAEGEDLMRRVLDW